MRESRSQIEGKQYSSVIGRRKSKKKIRRRRVLRPKVELNPYKDESSDDSNDGSFMIDFREDNAIKPFKTIDVVDQTPLCKKLCLSQFVLVPKQSKPKRDPEDKFLDKVMSSPTSPKNHIIDTQFTRIVKSDLMPLDSHKLFNDLLSNLLLDFELRKSLITNPIPSTYGDLKLTIKRKRTIVPKYFLISDHELTVSTFTI